MGRVFNSVPKLTEQPPTPWPLPGVISNTIKLSHVAEASAISSETSSFLSKAVMQPVKVKSIVHLQ